MSNKAQYTKSIVFLHLAVLLFGFTAILGVLIRLDALLLVWWRLLIAIASLGMYFLYRRRVLSLPPRLILRFSLIGILLALHWVSFFASVKTANASTALICFSTAGFFTSIAEPIILKKKFAASELLLGLAVIPAMYFIIRGSPPSFNSGIALGLLSAALIALSTSYNKLYLSDRDPLWISFVELLSGFLFLSMLTAMYHAVGGYEASQYIPQKNDFLYLLILGVVCTSVAYVLALTSLRHLSAFSSNLSNNLEPVYGIILAHILFDDQSELSSWFYLGALILLSSIFVHFFVRYKKKNT